MNTRKGLGFTLVELIVVIILLAIISSYAASRYIGVGSFSALVIQDSVISVARQVQLNRMQSNVTPPSDSFILQISTHCFGSVKGCANRDGRSDWVSENDVTFSALPDVTKVNFDLLGSPIDSASGGVKITIQGSNSRAVVDICANGLISTSGCN